MARSLNKVQLIGNVGGDPEFRTFGSDGTRLATFSLATSETSRNKATGESFDKTDWHRIAVFNENLVQVVEQYVRKGSKLYIEGRLQTRSWEDNQGQRRYMTEVVLRAFGSALLLLDAPRGGHDGGRDFSARGRDDASARPGGLKDAGATAFASAMDPEFAPSRPLGGAGGTPRRDSSFPASSGPSTEPDYGEELDDSIPF